MYSHSQRGICSVAPLTLPSRELSGACVYLPLFVLRSPRPCRENTSRGGGGGVLHGGNESHAELCWWPAPSPQPPPDAFLSQKRSERAEWLLTAALSHRVTCEEVLRFCTVVQQGTKHWIPGPLRALAEKHLAEEAFIVAPTAGARYNT